MIGIIWHLLHKACDERLRSGRGTLKFIWRRAHLQLDHIFGKGWDPVQWAANHLVDKLAGQAVSQIDLSVSLQVEIQRNTELVHEILHRLTLIVITLARSCS